MDFQQMYLKYYGLKQKPFSLSTDPQFLFSSRLHRIVLSKVIENFDHYPVTVVTGEKGSGKTTFIQALLRVLPREMKTILFAESFLDSSRFLNILDETFGLNINGFTNEALYAKLLSWLKEEPRNLVLIFDQAHLIKPEVFDLLTKLLKVHPNDGNYIHVILVGEPKVEDRILENFTYCRTKHVCWQIRLTGLNYNDTKYYIENRCYLAKEYPGITHLFTEEAIQKIYEHSGGILRKINIICNNALVLGYMTSSHPIHADIIEKVRSDESTIAEIKKLKEQPRQTEISAAAPKQLKTEQEKLQVETGNFSHDFKPGQKQFQNKQDYENRWTGFTQVKSKQPDRFLSQKSQTIEYEPAFDQFDESSNEFQRIIANLRLLSVKKTRGIIGFVSPVRQQGTTTITARLAYMLSLQLQEHETKPGKQGVLLIDANFRNPMLHHHFALQKQNGLCEVLSSRIPLEQGLRRLLPSELTVITQGEFHGMMFSQKHIENLARFLQDAKDQFDFVFLDLPPLLQDADAIELSRLCDGVIMIVQAGKLRWELVDEAKQVLNKIGVETLGAVLNQRKYYIPEKIYKMI